MQQFLIKSFKYANLHPAFSHWHEHTWSIQMLNNSCVKQASGTAVRMPLVMPTSHPRGPALRPSFTSYDTT